MVLHVCMVCDTGVKAACHALKQTSSKTNCLYPYGRKTFEKATQWSDLCFNVLISLLHRKEFEEEEWLMSLADVTLSSASFGGSCWSVSKPNEAQSRAAIFTLNCDIVDPFF